MNLIIDLAAEPKLILSQNNKKIDQIQWDGLYNISETLISKIEEILKKNKVALDQIDEIKVIASKESIVSTRIAKAIALGLKAKIKP